MMVQRNVQVQGSIDGLCGIYCLVHFLNRRPFLSARKYKSSVAFHALLKSAEKLKLLTANIIAWSRDDVVNSGYSSDELVKIFNETARRKRMSYRAHELDDVADVADGCSGSELLSSIFEQGGEAIIQACGNTHWILAHKIDANGTIYVRDSGHDEKYRKQELKRAPRRDEDGFFDGVAILPSKSKLARVLSA